MRRPEYSHPTRLTSANGKTGTARLSVPAWITRRVLLGAWFKAEWHEDGILFRYLGPPDYDPSDNVPKWADQ